MEQQLDVKISIPIPEDSVLIKRIEYQELKEKALEGTYWTMQDVEEKTGKKSEWIKENILFPSKFKRVLDVENGGFVFYPEVRGQTWSFQAVLMADFLDKNFKRIFN